MSEWEDHEGSHSVRLSTVITTTEMHTCGEPVRIIEGGYPTIPAQYDSDILQTRRYVRDNLDHLRQLVMLEPRGHKDMYGVLLLNNDKLKGAENVDMSVLFMHNQGYSTMCGHAIIALGRYAVDRGVVEVTYPETLVTIACPCGVVRALVECGRNADGTVVTGDVRFTSVPAFTVTNHPVNVTIPEYGKSVPVEIAYGGAFYALVTDKHLGLCVTKDRVEKIAKAAMAVTKCVQESIMRGNIPRLHHPDSDDLCFLYGTIITDGNDSYQGDTVEATKVTNNICVFADQAVDRSPCGSGVTARIALEVARGNTRVGQTRLFRGAVTGTVFSGKAIKSVTFGGQEAVLVEVKGRAHYCGRSMFELEDDDPITNGFLPY